jgi:aldose 1-epimerase
VSGPTGEQLEISQQAARAVVTTVGAGLRLYEVDGVQYTETFGADEAPPMGMGAVLVPWPNRVAGARWLLDGEPQDLEITEPRLGNAIHGLVRHAAWTVTEHGKAKVAMEVTVDAQPGYPFPFRTTISYELGVRGLNVTHGVHNLGDTKMPFGVGAHPYLRPGKAKMYDCDLKIPTLTMLEMDRVRKVPTGRWVDTRADDRDFRRGELLCDLLLDDAFGPCKPRSTGGLIKHSIKGREGGVTLWADPDFRWVQVYTPDDYPGSNGGATAIEPMTCPPDAFNSGIDLLHLDPGESWTGRWGIIPL